MNDNYPNSANELIVEEKSYVDIDQQATCLDNYDQKYHQISTGKYFGSFKTLSLGSKVNLYFETYNQIIDQWGAVPNDQYALLMSMKPVNNILVNGSTVDSNSFYFFTPGSTIEGRTYPGSQVCVVSFEKDFFHQFCSIYQSPNSEQKPNFHPQHFANNPANTRLIRQMILETVQYANSVNGAIGEQNMVACMQTSLANLAVGLTIKSSNQLENKSVQPSLKVIAKKCQNIIRDCQGKNIDINNLVEKMGVSRRTLETAFIQQLAVSPAAYIKRVQLNEIRSSLRKNENLDKSIGDIASDWGIWHLSRFAKQYKKQFGELPSETRA